LVVPNIKPAAVKRRLKYRRMPSPKLSVRVAGYRRRGKLILVFTPKPAWSTPENRSKTASGE